MWITSGRRAEGVVDRLWMNPGSPSGEQPASGVRGGADTLSTGSQQLACGVGSGAYGVGMIDPSPLIEVRRSARRRRTVSAYRDGDKIIILMPARTSKAEERRLVTEMVERVTQREAKFASTGPRAGDSALLGRARQLSNAYLEGRAQPVSVRWVRNMNHRWGSCTTTERTIRLSHRLQSMPSWVIDYVLVHELSHLLEPSHDRAFWQWAGRYPRTERARGFLEGIAVAAQLPELSDCDVPDSGSAGSLEPAGGLAGPDSESLAFG